MFYIHAMLAHRDLMQSAFVAFLEGGWKGGQGGGCNLSLVHRPIYLTINHMTFDYIGQCVISQPLMHFLKVHFGGRATFAKGSVAVVSYPNQFRINKLFTSSHTTPVQIIKTEPISKQICLATRLHGVSSAFVSRGENICQFKRNLP